MRVRHRRYRQVDQLFPWDIESGFWSFAALFRDKKSFFLGSFGPNVSKSFNRNRFHPCASYSRQGWTRTLACGGVEVNGIVRFIMECCHECRH